MENNYTDIYSKRNKEEYKETKGFHFGRGLGTLAAVGVGMYLIGHFTGIKDGYHLGFDRGIIHAVNNFEKGVEAAIKEQLKTQGN